MTTTRLASVLLLFPAFTIANAQTGVPPTPPMHPWTVAIEGAYASGVSASMRGTNSEFQSDLEKDYNNSHYPFGDPNAFGVGFGIQADYRFLPNDFGIYAAVRSAGFLTTETLIEDTAFMDVNTLAVGASYTYDLSNAFDLGAEAGINGSLIGGHIAYNTFFYRGTTSITTPNTRFGFELGLRADWNPWAFLLVRAFVKYSDMNVIGKSYTPPPTSPPNPLLTRALNDGANPNNPNDKPRTIDYVLSGLAIGVQF